MQCLRLLLLPVSLLYGLIISLRNWAYDIQIFSSQKFNLPIICIGNLAIGGAGKSPMAEYIIRLLKAKHKVAVLSRGYGRKTKGFRLVAMNDSYAEAGDEPRQFRQKFKDITVAVAEKRVVGIEALKDDHEVIILDDAFQHRAVQAGLNILLFDFTRLNDLLLSLPAGNLREPFTGRSRADILVVSKCPEQLSDLEKEKIERRLKPLKHQQLFFSYLDYGDLISINTDEVKPLSAVKEDTVVFLLTGIANPTPLVNKLKQVKKRIIHHDYPDHHTFTTKNILKLAAAFKAEPATDKIIITTEKDAQRLHTPALHELLNTLPVYYLPVAAKFHQPEEGRFNTLIDTYVKRSL